MITAFNHTSFTVTDMDRAVRFWTAALGFEAQSVSPRSGEWQAKVTGVPGAELLVAHLFGYGTHIELIQYTSSAGAARRIDPNMSCAAHICLEVSDLEETWAKLVKAGATPQGEVTSIINGPAKGLKAGYLRDPCGIIIELLEIPPAGRGDDVPAIAEQIDI
jgi:catechol 2,3-dioxygenase-like lactoylglutathione lyase family enzyme